MANKIGDLYYKITGDTTKLDKSIKSSNTAVTSFGKKLGGIGAIIKGALFAGAITFGIKKVLDIGKALITSSSDAQETRNKYSVVFASVADDAQAAADRIKDEFKLSDSTTEKFLSQVGDITSGLGATSSEALLAAEQITTLGLDIDSFANLSGGAEQAVSALTSLFTGEREAAKALGIVINDTNLRQYAEDQGKIFKQLSPLEKGFLSLELATTQSELALGDFARSQDSFANQSKIAKEAVNDLKVEIGEALLPTATTIVGTFGRLTGALAEFIKERNNLEEARKASVEGIATIDQRILDLTAQNNELQIEVNKKISGRAALIKDGIQLSEDDNAIYQEQIDLIENQIIANNRLIGTIQLRKILQGEAADAEELAEQARLELLARQEEAEALLSDRQLSRRSDNEVQIALLNEQIEKWVEFRDVTGVQELLNDLITERNALLAEGNELLAVEVISSGEALRALTEYQNAYIGVQTAYGEYKDEVIEGNEEMQVSWVDLANLAQNTMVTSLKAITEELAKGELSFQSLAKIALEGLSKILDALGEELLAIAAVKTVATLFGPIGATAALIGAAAAFAASGLISAAAGSFERGGIIPGSSFTGDNMIANVNSGEMVLNKQQQAQLFNQSNGGGGMSGPVTLVVDGRPFTAHFQKQINNKNIYSSKGGAL